MALRLPAFLLLAGAVPACSGVLEGVVLDSSTGRALARAHVTLQALRGAVPQNTALTDSSGSFRFLDLAGEPYFLTAQRTGYATARYGQRRWNGAGTPIVIEASGRFFAELRLQRLGAIGGEILDENRIGLPGVTVGAYLAGRQFLKLAASATSDDRGAFRLAGLEPGQYYVRTSALDLEDHRGLLPTYFGQTTRATEGRTVEVQLDSESRGTRIEPLAGRLGRIAGHVTGGLASSVILFSETGARTVAPGGNGQFAFDQLAPGEYELLAQGGTGVALVAWRRIRVGEGPSELLLELAPPPTLRVVAERDDGRPVEANGLLLVLQRQGLSQDLPVPAVTARSAAQVLPGEYSVRVQTPPGYCVQMLRLPPGAARNRLIVTGGGSEVFVTLSARPAKLHGAVRTGDGDAAAVGAPVFLNAVDPEVRTRIGGGRLTRAGQYGSYEFTGLPPGRYQVLSSFDFETPEEVDWQGTASQSVLLEEGGDAAVDLRVVR